MPCAQDNRNLEEIWISKAVDANQILLPKKVVQLTGQSFRAVRRNLAKMTSSYSSTHTCDSKASEIRVSSNIDFEWSHSNLDLEYRTANLRRTEQYLR